MNPRRIEVGGLGFSVTVVGEGSPVVLLHGFPDTSSVWRKQIPSLVDAGFRVIAPDLRGRGESDMAERVEDYAIPLLVQDVFGIMDAFDVERAAVVGHDWGAALTWVAAALVPNRVTRIAAVSVGHPASFSKRTARQLMLSWYMWIFAFDGVAEELFTRDDWRLFREWLSGQVDEDECIASLSKPGRFTAGLNWYRANITPASLISDPPQLPSITCPVLAVYGDRDLALSEEQMTGSKDSVTGPWRFEKFTGAGHWPQIEEAERFNQLLVDFLLTRF